MEALHVLPARGAMALRRHLPCGREKIAVESCSIASPEAQQRAAVRGPPITYHHFPCFPFAAFWRALVGSPRGGRELLALEGPRRMEPQMLIFVRG